MSAEKVSKFVQKHKTAIFLCVHEKTEDVVFSDERMPGDDQLETFAAALWDSIYEDAALLRGYQTYILRAKVGEKIVARIILGIETDTPIHSMDGQRQQSLLMAHLMRHNEKLMALNFQMSKAILPFGADFYIDRAAQFFKKEEELAGMRQDLARKISDEKRANEQHAFDLAAKKEVFDVIRLLVPTTVNAMAGKRILPEKTDPKYETVKAFAKTISPTQLTLLGAILDPAQNLAFLEFMKAVQAEEKEREKHDAGAGHTNS